MRIFSVLWLKQQVIKQDNINHTKIKFFYEEVFNVAKSKIGKSINEVKKDINSFIDEAKESTKDAANYIKKKTK
jgi:predicted Rossmann-fold nucleotide-binding protein